MAQGQSNYDAPKPYYVSFPWRPESEVGTVFHGRAYLKLVNSSRVATYHVLMWHCQHVFQLPRVSSKPSNSY